MEALKDFLLSPVGFGYIITGLLAVVGWLKKKKEPLCALVYFAFNAVEKAIPDNPDGKYSKLDEFARRFTEAYAAKYGAPPADETLKWALTEVEKLVFKKNSGDS